MIYLFNESNEKIWNLTSKNDFFYHIGLEDSRFGVDILKRDIPEDAFYTECFEPQSQLPLKALVLSSNSFNICYNNKSGLPFLKAVNNINDYSQDLYILSYCVPEGMELVFEKNGKFNILYTKYDVKRKMIHIIATAKPINLPFFYLTFADKDFEHFTTKHMTILKKNFMVSVFIQHYNREDVEKSEFRLCIVGKNEITDLERIKLKPSKVYTPYSVIIYPFQNESIKTDICEAKFNKDENHTKYVDMDSSVLIAELRKILNMKYHAATFYIDKNFDEVDIANDLTKIHGANLFDKVNYLTADGRIVAVD